MLFYLSGTMKDFLIQDQMWMSSLDDTKWLHLVAQCLSAGKQVANSVSNEFRRNIVIKGEDIFILVPTFTFP